MIDSPVGKVSSANTACIKEQEALKNENKKLALRWDEEDAYH
jgi:hypothetical protein